MGKLSSWDLNHLKMTEILFGTFVRFTFIRWIWCKMILRSKSIFLCHAAATVKNHVYLSNMQINMHHIQACTLHFGFTLNFIQVAYVVKNGKKKKFWTQHFFIQTNSLIFFMKNRSGIISFYKSKLSTFLHINKRKKILLKPKTIYTTRHNYRLKEKTPFRWN